MAKGLKIGRRCFLQGGVAAAMLGGGRAHAVTARPVRNETILVIGAGLAGLAAAYRLKDAGMRVIILEARSVAGGRVRTLRENFTPPLYAEAGAARIADTHEYVLHWVNELGLSLIPFQPAAGSALLLLGGRRAHAENRAERDDLTTRLHDDERGLSPAELLHRYVAGLPDELAQAEFNPGDPRWASYDRTTWPDWLRRRGASEGAIALMLLGGDSTDFSALYLLRQILLHRDTRQYFKIGGGMDLLPRGIAQRLKNELRYDCEVVRLEHNGGGVRAVLQREGATDQVTASRAVVAIPFPALARIAIAPHFSPEKTAAIAGLPYYAATRFLLQTKSRFWVAEGLNGGARGDAPADIWDTSFGEKGKAGLLILTTGGAAMERRLLTMPAAAREALGVALARAAFPAIDGELAHAGIQRWAGEPLAGGAFAVFHPGQMAAWTSAIARAEGRVHFAGEHTSPWTGWMEGALWSGERAAAEILGP